jgi:Tfp pilus assembly protein PilN
VSYLQGNRTLAERIAARDELQQRHDALVDELRGEVRTLEGVPWRSLAARIASTNDILRERGFSWLEMLDDIEEVLPYDVRIVKITPKVDGDRVQIGLEAVCRTRDALLELLDNMIRDPRFAEPTPRSEVFPEESDNATFDLLFTVTYLPGEAES